MTIYAFVSAQETFKIHNRLSSDAFDIIKMTSMKTNFDVVRALLSAGGPNERSLRFLTRLQSIFYIPYSDSAFGFR